MVRAMKSFRIVSEAPVTIQRQHDSTGEFVTGSFEPGAVVTPRSEQEEALLVQAVAAGFAIEEDSTQDAPVEEDTDSEPHPGEGQR